MTAASSVSEYGLERVPGDDIQLRIKRFQQRLAALDLDGALLLQNIDIYYFSGTSTGDALHPR